MDFLYSSRNEQGVSNGSTAADNDMNTDKVGVQRRSSIFIAMK
jgi:hypothetical protein